MAPLPGLTPDTDRRWVLRVSPDPYLRFDTCYSLHPAFVGRRVEARVTDSEVLATVLDTGELACRHPRSFAKHRTITVLEHARALRAPATASTRRSRSGRSRANRCWSTAPRQERVDRASIGYPSQPEHVRSIAGGRGVRTARVGRREGLPAARADDVPCVVEPFD